MENYSHILDIKVLNENTNCATNYACIDSIVKEKFLQKEITINNTKLNCEKKIWSYPNNQFNLGNIVIDSKLESDEILFETVNNRIIEIDKELRENNKLNKNKIIFKIYKIIG